MTHVTLVLMSGFDDQHSDPSENDYMPGICNIGKKEIERRRNAALFSFALCLSFVLVAYFFDLHPYWRMLLFFPAASFAISFQQWVFKFCVAFGLKGIFNFNEIGKVSTVEEKEYLREDKLQAWKMILLGILFALAVTFLFFIC
ncbi:MAG: hypothetical protein JNK00_00395 [Flavipsychrobacter sp.]|nr:hypothetical protein [Flavipsychrobacter sp.]